MRIIAAAALAAAVSVVQALPASGQPSGGPLERAPAGLVDPASFPVLDRVPAGFPDFRPVRIVSFTWTPPEALMDAASAALPGAGLSAFASSGRPVPVGAVTEALQSFSVGGLALPRAHRVDRRSLVAAAVDAAGAVLHYEVVRDPSLYIVEAVGPDGAFTGREGASPARVEFTVPAAVAALLLFRPVAVPDGSVLFARVGEVSGW